MWLYLSKIATNDCSFYPFYLGKKRLWHSNWWIGLGVITIKSSSILFPRNNNKIKYIEMRVVGLIHRNTMKDKLWNG